MNDTNESIDRVLEAMGRTEPDPQLTQRIARQLGERLEEGRQSSPAAMLPAWFPTVPSARGRLVTVFAGAAIALLIFSVEATHHKVAQRSTSARVSSPVSPPRSQEFERAGKLRTKPVHEEVVVKPRRGRLPNRVQSSAEPESAALDLAHAPSLLAPPMPLTAQERLLLKVAQRGRPEAYALLNPAVRAQSEAQDRNSFLAFFEPPRPPGPVK